jgi:hypothetical protein
MQQDKQQDNKNQKKNSNSNNNNDNDFGHPDCMCRMCRDRRGDRPLVIASLHNKNVNINENTCSHTLPQNHLLGQDLNDLKKTLVKYTNDNKINLSTKQVEIFISKFFEEFHKKYIITLRSKL